MGINVPNIVGNQKIFKASPEDDSSLIFQGQREIPESAASGQIFNVTKNPGTMADDDTIGDRVWNNVNNAKLSDDNRANCGGVLGAEGVPFENEIKIVKGGTIKAENKSLAATATLGDTFVSYGGDAELWGETWTPADINASDFGVVVSWDEVDTASWTSHYLKATNFGFTIPAGSTINGITAEIEQSYIIVTGRSQIRIDNIKMKINYTAN